MRLDALWRVSLAWWLPPGCGQKYGYREFLPVLRVGELIRGCQISSRVVWGAKPLPRSEVRGCRPTSWEVRAAKRQKGKVTISHDAPYFGQTLVQGQQIWIQGVSSCIKGSEWLGLPATPQECGLGVPAISWEVSTASEQKKFRIPK